MMLAASKSAKSLPKIFKPRKAQILSWCKFKRGLPCPDKPHHLESVFKEPLEKIYDRLSEPALLIICLPGYTQNANEFVDALAWNKCPKHELHGRKGIVMAASCAALHFSCGATKKIDVIRKAEISPGKHNWKEARQSLGQWKNSVSRAQSSRKTQTI